MQYARIAIVVPRKRVRYWARSLADVLHSGWSVPVLLCRLAEPEGFNELLPFERLERRLFGPVPPGYSDWVATREVPQADGVRWAESLIISALDRDPRELSPEAQEGTILSPVFEGEHRLGALIPALLNGEPPEIGVAMRVGGSTRVVHTAQVAVPDRDLTLRTASIVLGRTVMLVQQVVDHLLSGRPLPTPTLPIRAKRQAPAFAPLRRVFGTYIPKVGRQLSKHFVDSEHWCIAYRPAQSLGNPPEFDLQRPPFLQIESDRNRFYADPFLFQHNDVTALFFEDYNYGTQLGKISFVVLREDGTHSEPAESLSRPYHLSYPFVFADAGAALMVPETSQNRRVELYEAERFPDRWRLRSVLIDNINASDATLWRDHHTGVWWMFTAVSEAERSEMDTLSIFFASTVDGPWHPHASNPAKLVARSSRPAGPLMIAGTALLRPAQDCTRGYGIGLVWCEVKELTPVRFREEEIGRLDPGPGYTGLHTYSRAGGFEVVDLKRRCWHGIPRPKGQTHRSQGGQDDTV
jgi:hypothetical protein